MEQLNKLIELYDFARKDTSLKNFKYLLDFLHKAIELTDRNESLDSGQSRRLSKLDLKSLKEISSFYESIIEINRNSKSHTLKYHSHDLLKSTVNYFEFFAKRKKLIEKFNVLKSLLENEKYIQPQDSYKRFIEAFREYYKNLNMLTKDFSLEEKILITYLEKNRITNVDFDALFTYEVDNNIETSWSVSKLRQDYKDFVFFENKVGCLVSIDCFEFKGQGLIMSSPTIFPRLGKAFYINTFFEEKTHYFPFSYLSIIE